MYVLRHRGQPYLFSTRFWSYLAECLSLNRLPGRGNQRSGQETIDHPKFNILAKDSRDSSHWWLAIHRNNVLILHSFFYPALLVHRVCLCALCPALTVWRSLYPQRILSWSQTMKLTTSTPPSAFKWWSTMKLPHLAKRDPVYILRLAMSSLRWCRCLHYMVAMSLVCYFSRRICVHIL